MINRSVDAVVSICGDTKEGKWNEKLIRKMQANLEIM
jgi:hypothetical protein